MATIKFSIPDVPYSQVEFDPEEIASSQVLESALKFRADYLIAFPQKVQEPSQRPVQRPTGNGAPRNGNGGPKAHSGLFCPDHDGIELIQSNDDFQEYTYMDDGTKRPDKFFCPADKNGTGKNHSVWRSRALTREVVEEMPF